MRCDQDMGLSEAANKLLRDLMEISVVEVKVVGKRIFPNGKEEAFEDRECRPTYTQDTCGTYSGMFGDEYLLTRYTFPNGDVYEEFVQAEPWSSGPVFFLALKKNGQVLKESLWSEKEIEHA